MKIGKYLRIFFETFDIFAVKPADIYTFKKSFYYSNIYTKISSTIVAIMLLTYFIILFTSTISHSDPTLNYFETFTRDPKAVNFGNNGYFLAFGIQLNNKSIILDPTLFKMEMKRFEKNDTNDNITILFEQCNNSTGKSEEFNNF